MKTRKLNKMKAIELVKTASEDGTRFETSVIRELEAEKKIQWKDGKAHGLSGNKAYMVKRNESGMALYVLSTDPYQEWHYCGIISE